MFSGAKWLWTEKECKNQYVEILQRFDIDNAPEIAVLAVSADNEYAAYINGSFAGGGQYDDFPMHKSYNVHQVAGLLRKGENELLIRAYHQGENSFQYITGPAGVIFALDAGDLRVVSDETALAREYALYESGDMEKVSPQLGYTFHCDGTRPGENWEKVRIVAEREGTALYERPIKQLVAGEAVCEREVFSGVYALRGGDTPARMLQAAFIATGSDMTGADGVVRVFDLGRETAGLVHIEAECAAASLILVGYGEHLDDMRVRSAVGPRNFGFSYRAPAGRSEFTHIFRRIACRYLQVFAPAGIEIKRCTLIPVDYPVDERGAFDGCDTLMNRMYDISRRTLRLCMHEHYEDSPWREQGLYAMDSRNQALCGYTAFGESDFPLACLKLMAESIRPDGLMEICSPARDRITIPSFSLGWVISLRDFALYTGRTADAYALMPAAQAMLGFFRDHTGADGLAATPTEPCYWNFYEWAPGLDDGWEYGRAWDNRDGSRRDAPINLFFALALGCAADVAHWAGDEKTAAVLMVEKAALIANINRYFWDEAEGLYRSYTVVKPHYCELVQALALLAGAAVDDRAAALRRAIVEKDERLIPATLSYRLFVYEALLADDATRAAAVEDAWQLWGMMTLSGATSYWETIEGADAFSKAGSLCHGWSAVPAWLWIAGYLGIKPVEPGFAKFTYAPLPGAQADAVVPTPFGDICIKNGAPEYDAAKMTLIRS